MNIKAVFLDRDGTINYDTGYIGNPELIKLHSGVTEGIKLLKDEYDFRIIVISNQSGIARGYFTETDVDNVNNRVNELLSFKNTKIDNFYYCQHHPEFDSKGICDCRKPSPKMVLDAAYNFSIDLSKSFFIGDKKSDIECGINASLKTILLTNTMSDGEIIKLINSKKSPNFVSSKFLNAVEYIVSTINGDIVEN